MGEGTSFNSMEEGTLLICRKAAEGSGRHLISMGEGTSFVWRKAGKAGEGSNGD